MKAKIIILLACLLMIVDSASGQRANKISRDIRKVQISQYPKSKDVINDLYELRKKTKSLKEFIPFGKKDTIFMIEIFGAEYPNFLFTSYWNNTKRISIRSDYPWETFENLNDYIPRKYMTKLVTEWNIDEIRKEEIINRAAVTPSGVFATRIIFNGRKHKIDCVFFIDFFNLERDGFD